MQHEQARQFILDKLKQELSECFRYHNADHAVDVYQAARLIGTGEGITGHELDLLLTAAIYHDSGFLFGQVDHESRSCDNARLYLPRFDYNTEDIEQICAIIMATKMPQTPTNHLGQIICDADLDYLGRNDFFVLSKKLFSELVITDGLRSENDWDKLQIVFLQKHHYFTQTAITMRDAAKQEHLQQIIKKTL